ncbi:hypothetical protein [Anatilimnocola floriformis]|uniref:hypothetical protein n=1 Tax=Anatilimnocola floriformis TaxID=2948575 RepID=UPI0020C27AE1|nr:hypothetical protein [Anatilimnocola floriformis]
METNRPQISLVAILIVMTTLCVAFASWTSGWRFLVLPMAGAFLTSFIIRPGFYLGLGVAFVIAAVNAYRMEKDPSGLGPTEVVIVFHVIFFGLPVIIAAWLGGALQRLLWPKSLPADPAASVRSGRWLDEADSPE